MGNKRILTPQVVYWAHRKWCEGHGLSQIAAALDCCERTLQREFKKHNLVYVEIPLRYEGS